MLIFAQHLVDAVGRNTKRVAIEKLPFEERLHVLDANSTLTPHRPADCYTERLDGYARPKVRLGSKNFDAATC